MVVSPWIDLDGEYRSSFLNAIREKSLEFWLITRPPSKGQDQIHDDNIKELIHIKRTQKLDPHQKGFIWKKWIFPFKLIFVPYLHAKIIWADNKMALVSSLNLYRTSMERNEEAGFLFPTKGFMGEKIQEFIDDLIETYSPGPEHDLSIWQCIDCNDDIFNGEHKRCFNCYTKHIKNGTTCPECGGRKKQGFDICYPCNQKRK